MAKKSIPSFAAPVITEHDGFMVVRDDLLEGGTKRRALTKLLFRLNADEVVYAATAYGYGQLSLAYAGRDTGKKTTLFVAERTNLKKAPLMAEAMTLGATYHHVAFPNFMNVVAARAREYCEKTGATYLPMGFDTTEFRAELVEIAKSLPLEKAPSEIWVTGGTGTLARALATAYPHSKINIVTLGMKNGDMGDHTCYFAPEKFEQKAQEPPPYPSAAHYDAKLWRFAKKYGKKGALIWNVGR